MQGISLVVAAAASLLTLTAYSDPDSHDPKPKVVLPIKNAGVNAVAFSPDGKTIAAGCVNGRLEVYETRTGGRRVTLQGDCAMSIAFRPDGRQLACAESGGTVRLWDLATGTTTATLRGHAGEVYSVAFSADGTRLASAGEDKNIKIWDLRAGAVKTTLHGHTRAVRSVAFSSDGKFLASGSEDETVQLWDMATGKVKATFRNFLPAEPATPPEETISSVTFSPDGKLLASGSHDKIVALWDLTTGKLKATLEGHVYAVSAVAFSPDGKFLASVSGDGIELEEWEEPPEPASEIKLWDVTTGREKASYSGETGQMMSVAFSPDGKLIATGDWEDYAFSENGAVRLWDVPRLLKTKR